MNIIYKGEFHNGFARVQREDYLYNYIDNKGNLLSPKMWFNFITYHPSHVYVFGTSKSNIFFFTDNLKLHKLLIY